LGELDRWAIVALFIARKHSQYNPKLHISAMEEFDRHGLTDERVGGELSNRHIHDRG
jgi:hypothetical protein